ncbi:hypothetical protein LDENG_00125500 [Lucifuga dentata]|nr:hypothetical protein LDENG_00125500 [Lucifuga dentata]
MMRLQHFVFLILFCYSSGQIPSMNFRREPELFRPFDTRERDWRSRFTSIDSYWDLHGQTNSKDAIDSSPKFYLLAPGLLRADSQENIYLQASGAPGPVTVTITIHDFSHSSILLQDSVTLSLENGFHALKAITLPSEHLNREENKNKFVYLKAAFGGFLSLEKVLMVSFHSGYIFIQTDKPVYNPGDTVKWRAFVSAPSFKSFDSSITVDFQNPEGVVVKQIARSRTINGVLADAFPLSELVSEGTWTVIAKFDHWQQNTYSTRFEVKKYVLPAFNVTLTPRKSFLSVDDRELEVEISARYLYGEPVQGKAYVVFGVKTNNEMKRLPSVKQVSDLNNGVVTLSMEELRRTYPNIDSLVGSFIYVKASVLTSTGSDLVEAEKSNIKIVQSPYILSFKDVPKYFKPGLPFDLTIQVSHHDGSPARNVPVKLSLLDVPVIVTSGTARATINMPKDRSQILIAAETQQAGLRAEQQARQQIRVDQHLAFNVRRQNFLYISSGTNVVSVGDRLSLKLTINMAEPAHRGLVTQLTYLILNKGKIIAAERLDVGSQVVTSVGLTVTPEMMPSFRFVAYYSIPWEGREEVVADSIWMDVADSCVGTLNVGPVDGILRDYRPAKSFTFKVTGDPGAKVNLVAVDNAVYLLSKERLTQGKIWNTVESRDIGCTRGGGKNAMRVFSDAGLLFVATGGSQTQTRQALQCPSGARRRRSAELLQRKAQLESHYKDKLLRRCCKDGLRDVPMPYSCTRRSLYITEDEFVTEFPTRLPSLTTVPPTTVPPTTSSARPTITTSRRFGISVLARDKILLTSSMFDWGRPSKPKHTYTNANKVADEDAVVESARTAAEEDEEEEEEEEEDWEYMDESDVYVRSKFYESWLWMDVNLPSTVDKDGLASHVVTNVLPDSITEWGVLNRLASHVVTNVLPDSITEWGVLAVSASPHTGFCVAEPYNIRAWKHFFVDLKLPYSVARNEQVEIKAVLHNYGDEDMHVRVVLMKTEGMCSIAFKDRHTQEVTLAAGSSLVVPYTIVPLVVGKLPLEVMVLGRDLTGADGVRKLLRVVMEGVQKTEVWSVVLNPSASGGTQLVHVGKTELELVVPNSQPETFINVRGNVLADSIDNSITEDSLASLIQMPGGCVEQNLARMTLPLIATLYLERTNGWENVGVQRKAEAIQYIRRGYENQLAYRRSDGSYPPYKKEGASTWITAFVVKVFSMAHSVIGINKQHVCDPLTFLIRNKEREGVFREYNPVYSTTMLGGVRSDEAHAALTAFVIIALGEAKEAGINCSGVNVEAAMMLSANYLKSLIWKVRRPYSVAITSYALSLMNEGSRYPLTYLRRASPGGSTWLDRENHLFTLEATGYALLALVKLGQLEAAAAPFKWLNSQRRRGGGFGSTQSTLVVLQALSEYLIHKPPPADLSLQVDIRMSGRKELRYHFDPRTSYVARSSRLPDDLTLEVEARGNGEGILEVRSSLLMCFNILFLLSAFSHII